MQEGLQNLSEFINTPGLREFLLGIVGGSTVCGVNWGVSRRFHSDAVDNRVTDFIGDRLMTAFTQIASTSLGCLVLYDSLTRQELPIISSLYNDTNHDLTFSLALAAPLVIGVLKRYSDWRQK